MIWKIQRRHHSTTQYQPRSLSSLCYLKIYLKPSTYKRKNVVKRKTQNHPPHHWIKPIHVMDMTLTLISSTMMSIMHSKKNRWCCLRVFASLVFGNSLKTSFFILMEVNKTMYGNNEDVQKMFLDNLYPESHLCDVTFAVVWNVLVADENKSVNRPSMNWTLSSFPMCLFVHGTICLNPSNIK